MSDSGPFGSSSAEIGVGFSDAALLVVSAAGFCMLAVTVYSIIVTKLKTAKELARDDLAAGGEDYDARIAQADVATLNRAQRRARARTIMKQTRRVVAPQGGPAAAGPEDAPGAEPLPVAPHIAAAGENAGEAAVHLSRKERQRLAKETEKAERRLFEEDRRLQQKQAQELAQQEKREREQRKAHQAQEERRLQRLEREKQEKEILDQWNCFISSPRQSQSVDSWIHEMKQRRHVLIPEVASSFDVPSTLVVKRINELIQQGRIAGVIEDETVFIYISDEELQAMAQSILSANQPISLSHLADICNQHIFPAQES